MIVVDASIVVPALLPDERDWPADVARRLSGEALTAPAHWPVEVMNVLHVAERRGRIGRDRRRQAIEAIKAFGVVVAEMGEANWTGVSALAEKHRLTVYDAAYLHLALIGGAALATLDDELVAAARLYDLEVLTY